MTIVDRYQIAIVMILGLWGVSACGCALWMRRTGFDLVDFRCALRRRS